VDQKNRQASHFTGWRKMWSAAKALFEFLCIKCCGWRKSKAFKVDYTLPTTFSVAMSYEYQYRTLLNETQNHGAAFQVLADVLKFWSVRSLDFRFAVARMRRTANEKTTDLEAIWLYLQHAQNQMAHAISGFLFTGIFENMFFLHMQISLTAINFDLPTNNESVSGFLTSEIFMLIVVNLMLSLLKFVDAISVINVYTEVRQRVTAWETLMTADDEKAKMVMSLWRSMSLRFFRYLLYVMLYMWLLFLAFAKVYAIFGCPCKLWNLTGGCATLDGTGAMCNNTRS